MACRHASELHSLLLKMLKRHHAPVALVVTALGTIVLSIIVSITSGDYYDGLSVPFISYVGRDEPSYYVFAIGMSLSGAAVRPEVRRIGRLVVAP